MLHIRQIIDTTCTQHLVERPRDGGGVLAGGGVDAAEAVAEREAAEKLVGGEGADTVLGGVVEKILTGGGAAGVRAEGGAGDVDAEGECFQFRGQQVAKPLLDKAVVAEDAGLLGVTLGIDQAPLADRDPGKFPGDELLPAAAELALIFVGGLRPALHVDEERELGEVQIPAKIFERAAGE